VDTDLAHIYDMAGPPLFHRYECEVTQVLENGALALGDDDSPVLLIGDSFSCLYAGLTKGEVAGGDLARQLMLRLGAPVQTLTEYGIDPLNARAKLWAMREALSHKKVIVWQFAARHLEHPETWKRLPVPELTRIDR
jgi:hypothetical protein